MQNRFVIGAVVLMIASCQPKPVAQLEVRLPEPTGLDQYIPLQLDSLGVPDIRQLQFVRQHDALNVPVQADDNYPRLAYLFIDGNTGGKVRYSVNKKKSTNTHNTLQQEDENGTVTLSANHQSFLQYHYATVFPPAGVDSVFGRSAFIHPLLTPHGQELTRIQPADHYHHYGIWNPWTHVLFEGDTLDFWNLYKRQGTVRFVKFLSKQSGPLFSEFTAQHAHVVFDAGGVERTALDEIQTIRVSAVENQDYYFVDITSTLKCASESPFLILKYRYGGLGWRAIEAWNADNSEVLTSENKTREDADGTTARWCLVQGKLGDDFGGMVIFSHPDNYNHPEPLRIWPPDSNGGQLFVNVAPTKTKDWLLEPGKVYTLRYRMIIFNGHFTKEKAEAGWQQFARSPEIKFVRH